MQKFFSEIRSFFRKKPKTLCVDTSCVSCLIVSLQNEVVNGEVLVAFLRDWLPPFGLANSLQHHLCNFYRKSYSCQYKIKVHSSWICIQIHLVSLLGKDDCHIIITTLVHQGVFLCRPNSPLFFSFLLHLCEHILTPLT